MHRYYFKMLLMIAIVAFCILFGVSVAKQGVDRVHGGTADEAVLVKKDSSENEKLLLQLQRERKAREQLQTELEKARADKEKQLDALGNTRVYASDNSNMNGIGNRLGDLVQGAARGVISVFAGLFDAF
ncbi:hypothetical protein NV379_24050 [Paenibacillus sp. N1-5-1-14]|uniref:hypothetical protein n=1 Tax=Paenibacillus radicibacter TaxID=2972488 RepID=UPI002159626D|nr:hypothetical protein [Paenibacillus radicibacter]MCR8645717.1 hypothetical protein [Paenibacillus radicibacter]